MTFSDPIAPPISQGVLTTIPSDSRENPYKFLPSSHFPNSNPSFLYPSPSLPPLLLLLLRVLTMEELEFQESEVIFPESVANGDNGSIGRGLISRGQKPNRRKASKKKKKKKSSVPVKIPENIAGNLWCPCGDSDFVDDGDGGEVVPPHVVVERRILARKMAFSVCTGNGRTLKGRDLSQFRNSILRMTGFLEA
ncbi:uncharacterized protein LOC127808318 [Diospyros lotus]|uniref:uncharacterized protein LOC127808318 n=1 Tax=Diospyros lotus TaxID=55363 RepID=UPI00224E3C1D|nr:uncharacterized protein LOC127808318 [Diospyros lotus]